MALHAPALQAFRRIVPMLLGVLVTAAQGATAGQPLPEGSAAAEGSRVYAIQCASCHGAEGEGFIGPPVFGPDAALGSYGNGKKLLDYISATMPQNNPGGLTDAEYQQVLAFLLVRNGFVEPGWSPETQPPEEIALEP